MAHLMSRSSIFLPASTQAFTQAGGRPRPVQTTLAFSGERYLGFALLRPSFALLAAGLAAFAEACSGLSAFGGRPG
jgi:hypothetical protein